MAATLYGPDGKPIYETLPITRQIGQDSYSVQYRGMTFLPNPDTLINRHGFRIYREMMNDVEVRNSVNAKRFAVISSSFQIIPASNSQEDIGVANFIRWVLDNMDGSVDRFLYEVLQSIIYGYSITEKVYDICEYGEYKNKYIFKILKAKYPGDYQFETDEFANIAQLKLRTNFDAIGIAVPKDKFVIHTYNPQHGWPHGDSDLRAVYKHYWSADFLVKWWNIYCETFGMPTRVAKYPATVYEQKDTGEKSSQKRLQTILEDIMNNTAITIPNDIELEFKEVAMGGALAFQKAIEFHNKQIKTGILGQTLTSSQGTGSSSYALGAVHGDTMENYVEVLRGEMSDSVMFEQIIKPLVRINYPGIINFPRFKMTPRRLKFTQMAAQDVKLWFDIGMVNKDDFNTIRDQIGLPPLGVAESAEVGIPTPDISDPGKPPAPVQPGFSKANNNPETPTFSRPFNKYEKRTDFVKMANDMGDVNNTLIVELSAIVQRMKNKMVAYVPQLFENGKVSAQKVNDLMLIGLKDFQDTLKKNWYDTLEKQLAVAYSEIDDGILAKHTLDEAATDIMKFAQVTMSDRVVPEAEVAMIKKWRETGNWKAMRAWRGRKAAELAGNMDAQSFWVTDVVKSEILAQVKNKIMGGTLNGADVRTTTKMVAGVFEKYIERGDIANKKLAEAPRLEMIIRTNTTRVFATARVQAGIEGAATGNYPAMEFTAVMDDRTSEICESLDGSVYAADDDIWGNITPPLHENCRSTVVFIHKDDLPEKYNAPFDTTKIRPEFGGTGE